MMCSNCGKDIPFNGKVCPYCKVDKSHDQELQALGCLGIFVGGGLGAIIGNLISDSGGLALGMFIGAVVGVFVGRSFGSKKPTQAIAPTVQITSNSAPPPVVSDENKACPFCAEIIKRAAIKCRYCQSDLGVTSQDK